MIIVIYNHPPNIIYIYHINIYNNYTNKYKGILVYELQPMISILYR